MTNINIYFYSELKDEYSEPPGNLISSDVPQLLQAIYGYRPNVFDSSNIQQQQVITQRYRKYLIFFFFLIYCL